MVLSISEKQNIAVLMFHWSILEQYRAMSYQCRFYCSGFLVNKRYLCPPITRNPEVSLEACSGKQNPRMQGPYASQGLRIKFWKWSSRNWSLAGWIQKAVYVGNLRHRFHQKVLIVFSCSILSPGLMSYFPCYFYSSFLFSNPANPSSSLI